MSEEKKEEKAPEAIIRRIIETTAFDPERGTYRAIDIRFEYPEGVFHDILIPKEEYTPELAEKKVREWIEKYGVLVGRRISSSS